VLTRSSVREVEREKTVPHHLDSGNAHVVRALSDYTSPIGRAAALEGDRAIPFNHPSVEGNELEYISQALAAGHISGDGRFGKQCEALLEGMLSRPRALLTSSCTHALEMAAFLLEVGSGDEVIIPSFTFVSTANAFVLRGARPVFVDIRRDTLNIDERLIESLISPRTRAIVVVHYAGVACEMSAIRDIADRFRLAIVEDNAHGLFGRYRGQYLGTFGELATQSFHETKNITCGEGGALLVNDQQYVERAEVLREKGTNRNRFFRGQVDKYTWVDVGSSYVLSEMQGAFLWGQLESRAAIQSKRKAVWEGYWEGLFSWAETKGVGLPHVPAHCVQSYHMFYLLLPSLECRQALIAHLKERNIMAVFHYQPLHISPVGLRLGGQAGACPVTEDVSERVLLLPFYSRLTLNDQDRVIDAITSFDL
jgi:dTDP-4-amino-4,6-dideoxygalactose transaminase